jgi:hypothetical protein
MKPTLRAAFESEMKAASQASGAGDLSRAFHHLERAHVLGQAFVTPHLRAHVAMLRIGLRRRDAREVIGQLLRIPAGAIGSALGFVPLGNTGGADVSAFARMEIPNDLQRLLE